MRWEALSEIFALLGHASGAINAMRALVAAGRWVHAGVTRMLRHRRPRRRRRRPYDQELEAVELRRNWRA